MTVRVLGAAALAAALSFGASSAARAADCAEMRASHGESSIWTCRLAFNDGERQVSDTQCFLSSDEGFRWMQRRSSRARGQFTQGNCRNQGQTMRYRDWVRQQG